MTPRETRRRRAWERELLSALQARVRGSHWRKKSNFVFREERSTFVCATVDVSVKDDAMAWRVETKPMTIDPILWAVLGMSENERAPLSLRADGAFTCSGLPVDGSKVSTSSLDPDVAAERFIAWADERVTHEMGRAQGSFSDQVKASDSYRRNGAHAAALVCSLVDEGELQEALDLARTFASGERRASLVHTADGLTFFERAVVWLSARA